LLIALLSLALIVFAPQTALAGTYTVKPGDTLWRIAQAHNISVEALQKANNLGESGVVIVGQVLTVPGAATTAPRGAHTPAARRPARSPRTSLPPA
jgi:LysM repeat protein